MAVRLHEIQGPRHMFDLTAYASYSILSHVHRRPDNAALTACELNDGKTSTLFGEIQTCVGF